MSVTLHTPLFDFARCIISNRLSSFFFDVHAGGLVFTILCPVAPPKIILSCFSSHVCMNLGRIVLGFFSSTGVLLFNAG